jgi:hypothetical protein
VSPWAVVAYRLDSVTQLPIVAALAAEERALTFVVIGRYVNAAILAMSDRPYVPMSNQSCKPSRQERVS